MVAAAVVVASLALHIDTVLYWIGPAGCIILVPALVIVLALPLLGRNSPLAKAGDKTIDIMAADTSDAIPASELIHETSARDLLPPDSYPSQQLQLGLSGRQLAGLRQFDTWLQGFIGTVLGWSAQRRPFDLLSNAEKIKITERIKPDGVRERSVMIFYRK
jgi:hypothetical protein